MYIGNVGTCYFQCHTDWKEERTGWVMGWVMSGPQSQSELLRDDIFGVTSLTVECGIKCPCSKIRWKEKTQGLPLLLPSGLQDSGSHRAPLTSSIGLPWELVRNAVCRIHPWFSEWEILEVAQKPVFSSSPGRSCVVAQWAKLPHD